MMKITTGEELASYLLVALVCVHAASLDFTDYTVNMLIYSLWSVAYSPKTDLDLP